MAPSKKSSNSIIIKPRFPIYASLIPNASINCLITPECVNTKEFPGTQSFTAWNILFLKPILVSPPNGSIDPL